MITAVFSKIFAKLWRHLPALAIKGKELAAGPDELVTRPKKELLEDLKEAIDLVSTFLTDRKASLDAIVNSTGFERNKAIVVAKEAVNENSSVAKSWEEQELTFKINSISSGKYFATHPKIQSAH